MQDTTSVPLIEQIAQQLETLPEDQLLAVQDFVDYLVWKYQPPTPQPGSAEARAIARIKDLDDPSQWITVVDIDDEIDEEALDQWLDARGYRE